MVFSKKEKGLKTLKQAIRIYSPDIGMEFGIEKRAMLIRKSGRNRTAKSGKHQNTWREWKLQVIRNIIKQPEMKKK